MSYQFDSQVPIYSQLVDIFEEKIIRGEWAPGSKLDGVRSLAVEYGVNPNTMQRALQELEKKDCVFTERTAGRFVTTDVEVIKQLRYEKAHDTTANFIAVMKNNSITKEQTMELVEKYWKE